MTIAEKLKQVADNEVRVYNAGRNAAQTAFWDTYQQHGERRNYRAAFYGEYWTDETFQPPYPLVVEDGWNMFCNSQITDLLQYYGSLDFSACGAKGAMGCFQGCEDLMIIGAIDLSRCKDIRNFFNGCRALQMVLDFTFPSGEVSPLTADAFKNCTALWEINVVGSIDYSVSFAQSVSLSTNSIESIVAALNPSVTGQTLTLAADAAGQFSAEQWDAMLADKGDWTVVTV